LQARDIPATLSRADGENTLELRLLNVGTCMTGARPCRLRLLRLAGEASMATPGTQQLVAPAPAVPAPAMEPPVHPAAALRGPGWAEEAGGALRLVGGCGYIILPLGEAGAVQVRVELDPAGASAPCHLHLTDGEVEAATGPVSGKHAELTINPTPGTSVLRLELDGEGWVLRQVSVQHHAATVGAGAVLRSGVT
jgi:hypothetical protein